MDTTVSVSIETKHEVTKEQRDYIHHKVYDLISRFFLHDENEIVSKHNNEVLHVTVSTPLNKKREGGDNMTTL